MNPVAHAKAHEEQLRDEFTSNTRPLELADSGSTDQTHPTSSYETYTCEKHDHSPKSESMSTRSATKPQVADVSTSSKTSSRAGRNVSKPLNIVGTISKMIFPKTTSASPSKSSKHQDNSQEEIAKLKKALKEKYIDNADQEKEITHRNKVINSWAAHEKTLLAKLSETERKYERKAAALYDKEADITSRDFKIKKLREKNKELQNERDSAILEVQDIVRKQQEESFKNIESALWIPREDGQVKIDLDELKRSMKNLAKAIAIPEFPGLSNLRQSAQDAILAAVDNVTRAGLSGVLLDGMSKKKSPAVILNALLSHAIYTKLFEHAFFFNIDLNNGSNPLAALYDMTMKGKPANPTPGKKDLTFVVSQ